MHRWVGRVLIVQDDGSLVGVWELDSGQDMWSLQCSQG